MAPITLGYSFDHPVQSVFVTLAAANGHRRFVPTCRESRVLGAKRLEAGRELRVAYVLESRKFHFRWRGEATLRVDPEHRQITLGASIDGADFAAVVRVVPADGGGTSLRAMIRCPPLKGALRLLPLGVIVRRSFHKTMQSITRYLDEQRGRVPPAR